MESAVISKPASQMHARNGPEGSRHESWCLLLREFCLVEFICRYSSAGRLLEFDACLSAFSARRIRCIFISAAGDKAFGNGSCTCLYFFFRALQINLLLFPQSGRKTHPQQRAMLRNVRRKETLTGSAAWEPESARQAFSNWISWPAP